MYHPNELNFGYLLVKRIKKYFEIFVKIHAIVSE